MGFKPTVIRRLIHFLNRKTLLFRAPFHKKRLDNLDFSIISNNCWGGIAYEYYGLQKKSPTVGSYMFPDDYLVFSSHLKEYLDLELKIISVEESLHKKDIIDKGNRNTIIGRLEKKGSLPPVEIVFLHYSDSRVVVDKWERRKARVNYNNLIFKFSFQNGCSEKHLKVFDSLELPGKKIMFVKNASDVQKYNCAVYYPGFERSSQIENDTFYWNRYFFVSKFINDGVITPRK